MSRAVFRILMRLVAFPTTDDLEAVGAASCGCRVPQPASAVSHGPPWARRECSAGGSSPWLSLMLAMRSLGQVIATAVVQERCLWLSLAQTAAVDRVHFLDAPISQTGLFGDIAGNFAQQFSAVHTQTKTVCPQCQAHGPLGAQSLSVCRSAALRVHHQLRRPLPPLRRPLHHDVELAAPPPAPQVLATPRTSWQPLTR
ncbi:hypothetical protein Q8A67_000128 [Cirrhinus molitorella]|uniref:Uncharacterized protein n=1 Tax=Cirrhinus molitorella TaxID=172907 RepID=A0AA88QMX8_9TELE|nr:hypothetical protein Q8A67_000128 [Cirrhinus molitorella]